MMIIIGKLYLVNDMGGKEAKGIRNPLTLDISEVRVQPCNFNEQSKEQQAYKYTGFLFTFVHCLDFIINDCIKHRQLYRAVNSQLAGMYRE
jgi:hypothetical protein